MKVIVWKDELENIQYKIDLFDNKIEILNLHWMNILLMKIFFFFNKLSSELVCFFIIKHSVLTHKLWNVHVKYFTSFSVPLVTEL